MKKRKEKLQTIKNIEKIRSITKSMIEKGSPLTDEFVKAFQNIEDIIDDINSLLFAGKNHCLFFCSLDMHDHYWIRLDISFEF